MKAKKRQIIIIVLIVLSGIFVYTTADPEKVVMDRLLGGIGSFSLLTIIFFIAGMLKEGRWQEMIMPYIIVFGLFVIWSMVFGLIL